MPDIVRVANRATGATYNWPRSLVGIDSNLEIIDHPTHDAHGAEIPAKSVPEGLRRAPDDSADADYSQPAGDDHTQED